jgi:hypothetical protein
MENTDIPGYEPPSKINYSNKSSIYKTFTPGLKAKKNEKFGRTTAEAKYGQYDFEEEKCPECNLSPKQVCFCGYNDKTCANGHTWYYDRDGKLKNINPHKK